MQVEPLPTGRVRGKRALRSPLRYLTDDWADETLPVQAFLVRHDRGLCLFDTGQTPGAALPGYFPAWQPFFRLSRFELDVQDDVVSQLARQGVEPADISRVVLSHLHTDHVGGIDAFPHAEVLVSAVEWRRARGLAGRLRGYLPDRWPPEISPTLVRYGDGPLGPFGDSLALDDDGALVLLPLPGHTPGHMALLLRDGDARTLLAGDAAHSRGELADRLPAVASWCERQGVRVLLAHEETGFSG